MGKGSQSDKSNRPIRHPLGRLLIERKTGITAVLAFLLAFGASAIQVVNYFRGAEVSLFAPEQILINFEPVSHQGEDRRFMRVGARMAYVNSGSIGYNATILQESVSFELNGMEYVQLWQSEHEFSNPNHDHILDEKYIAEARPRQINAGSSLSREVYFSPVPQRCPSEQTCCKPDIYFLFWDPGFSLISDAEMIKFTFKSYIFGEEDPKIVSCTVDLTITVLHELENNMWSSMPCWP